MNLEEIIEAAVARGVARGLANKQDLELLTAKQAAALLQVGESTIRAWVEDGLLPRYGSSRVLRVRREDVLGVRPRSSASDTPTEELARELLDKPRRGR